MSAEIIYGNQLAEELRQEMKEEVRTLNESRIHPKLVVVIIGEDPASMSYVKGKQRASEKVGLDSDLIELPEETTEEELLSLIDRLNHDETVHGILVQLPVPDHISDQKIIEAIAPEKDVDGFHPSNVGKMMTGQDTFFPCTPYGIVVMLERANIDLEGKHVVIVGRSNLVGKPVGQLLLNKNATVTHCHSRTKDLRYHTKQADILIVAAGKASLVSGDDIKQGAVVIDVGVNRVDGKLTGDVDFESALEVASHITPVPKGVGPMTITMLLHNTIKAAKRIHHYDQ
ncbi:bifunctional methylenetetrahydrofolate dehydrogenase/methenyltetrahydrofolate cyclohydrolase FolD [Halobacillus sp. ACCC02827]|uniref:bifunctional methylenetetrahydrofolate dehydrogenase/methenyltetrahydrofolate cyclohydrolase FolD n=1 Tax=Bacillaceae TaxID=186817 RepID=UPI0002A4E35A|nr:MULTISPECIES: bifunctional methylenetetrahydrofolate dehydrogenase/methenyltetrahydrofolate cyclohydrolase FolD [Bacillaceae]ELK46264.1 bifunctional 5,10-methylene-tetrahydrofolate dehydrogenase/ 5,10-methylene-tetrahydrofolate cyclohydrolase [Halobacillus sp. BAB-2008]QHT47119.1 bifunctional methylenetetrahydrofolate dehydrogenase/methenyltetrahydrofolate cyclohydrolase FolD [Bacillus sp. SB49]WJE14346.1 bifunctional methylenetetrahydrofolate dehydrogenase/methenyltetrahydrofolate cyclohydro